MDPNQPDYLQKIQAQRQAEAIAQAATDEQSRQTEANDKIVGAVNDSASKTAEALKNVKGSVTVENLKDIAKSGDIDALVDAINKLNLTTFATANKPATVDTGMGRLANDIEELKANFQNQGLKELADQMSGIVEALKSTSKALAGTKITVDASLQKTIDGLKAEIAAIDFNPSVDIQAPVVNVPAPEVDLKPITTALLDVKKAIAAQKFPPATDLTPVTAGLQTVYDAIAGLRFPVANYVLPFRQLDTITGAYKDVQATLDANGAIPTSGGGSTAPATLLSFITNVPTAGTRVQLASNTVTNGFIIQAPSTNPGMIYVGGATVSGTVFGAELQPGQSTSAFVGNTNLIYIDASVNSCQAAVLGS